MNTFAKYDNTTRPHLTVDSVRNPSALSNKGLRMGLAVLISLGVGLAVIISTYYVDNVKLLIGLIGGFVFVLITIRWPEFGILSW